MGNFFKQKNFFIPASITIAAFLFVYVVAVFVYTSLNQSRISVKNPELDIKIEQESISVNGIKPQEEFLISFTVKPYKEKVIFHNKKKQISKLKITNIHTYLNHLTAYGKIDREDYAKLVRDKEWIKMNKELDWLREKGVAPSKLLNDIEAAKACAVIAELNNPEIGLRYLHRIFHDLDTHINNVYTQEDWGVTHAFGNKEDQEMLYQFIKNGIEAAY